jgi:hypothetical protein
VFCRVNSEALKASDLGLKSAKGDVTLRDVKGQLSFEDELIHVERLQFGAGTSTFILSGDITEFDLPKVTLELSSMYVHSEDLSRLMALSYPSKDQRQNQPGLNAVSSWMADLRRCSVQKLYAVMKLKNDILDGMNWKWNLCRLSLRPRAGWICGEARTVMTRIITVDKISLINFNSIGLASHVTEIYPSANISMSGAESGDHSINSLRWEP